LLLLLLLLLSGSAEMGLLNRCVDRWGVATTAAIATPFVYVVNPNVNLSRTRANGRFVFRLIWASTTRNALNFCCFFFSRTNISRNVLAFFDDEFQSDCLTFDSINLMNLMVNVLFFGVLHFNFLIELRLEWNLTAVICDGEKLMMSLTV
jgi:hypothetical protein